MNRYFVLNAVFHAINAIPIKLVSAFNVLKGSIKIMMGNVSYALKAVKDVVQQILVPNVKEVID